MRFKMRFKKSPQVLSILGVGVGIIALACSSAAATTPPLPPTQAPLTSTTEPATTTPVPTSPTSSEQSTPTPRPTTADFTFQPEGVARGDNNQTVITFTATASDPDGDPLTFEWRFSSGTPSTATGQVATTTFPGRAPYTVTLTVSDGKGGTVTVEKTVPIIG